MCLSVDWVPPLGVLRTSRHHPPHPPVLLLHARAVSAFSLGTPRTSEELWGVKTLRGGYYLQDVFRKCCVFVDG